MKVLVTGATGFVGLNIVQALQTAGHTVVSYQRANARRRYVDELGIEVVVGELHDEHTLAKALEGADAVVHTAGLTSCNRRDLPALQATNVRGTEGVLRAARLAGVPRLVYTSTTSTIGSVGEAGHAADEHVPLTGWRARSPYAVTKSAAERILLDQDDVPCVILNPAEVVGPWDHTLQWGRIVLAVAAGQLPFVPPGSATFCSAGDVAQAHVSALTHGRAGQRYILGGCSMPIARFIDMAAGQLHCAVAPRQTAPWPLLRAQSAVRQACTNLGLPWVAGPAVDPYRMRVFGGHHLFDNTKARRELGYACSGISEAITQCIDWYRTYGFLAAPITNAGAAAAPRWSNA